VTESSPSAVWYGNVSDAKLRRVEALAQALDGSAKIPIFA